MVLVPGAVAGGRRPNTQDTTYHFQTAEIKDKRESNTSPMQTKGKCQSGTLIRHSTSKK